VGLDHGVSLVIRRQEGYGMRQHTRHIRNHVVVGTDGSDPATRAVQWAAREAALRHLPLRVVHGFVWPQLHTPLSPPAPMEIGSALRDTARQLLADAADAARTAEPDLEVQTSLVDAGGAAALLRSAADAAVLVVGTRGLGGFSGLIVGSTGVQLAMYAPCPIVVIRDGDTDTPDLADRPVVVGVDASEHAAAALGFAFQEASLRGAPLRAVHAWTEPVSTGPGDMLPLVYDVQKVQGEENRLLAEMLAGWSDKHPDVTVTRDVVRGRADHALIEASSRAQLLVVGARGVGGFRGLLFGSVSQAALHHAHCPVAVVRPSGAGR
jgi:nucleotide-binding universal stress UspA family protein